MEDAKHGLNMYLHYEVSVPHNIDRACVQELEVVEQEDDVLCLDSHILEWLEAGAERDFEVVDGRKRMCAEPGLDMG